MHVDFSSSFWRISFSSLSFILWSASITCSGKFSGCIKSAKKKIHMVAIQYVILARLSINSLSISSTARVKYKADNAKWEKLRAEQRSCIKFCHDLEFWHTRYVKSNCTPLIYKQTVEESMKGWAKMKKIMVLIMDFKEVCWHSPLTYIIGSQSLYTLFI